MLNLSSLDGRRIRLKPPLEALYVVCSPSRNITIPLCLESLCLSRESCRSSWMRLWSQTNEMMQMKPKLLIERRRMTGEVTAAALAAVRAATAAAQLNAEETRVSRTVIWMYPPTVAENAVVSLTDAVIGTAADLVVIPRAHGTGRTGIGRRGGTTETATETETAAIGVAVELEAVMRAEGRVEDDRARVADRVIEDRVAGAQAAVMTVGHVIGGKMIDATAVAEAVGLGGTANPAETGHRGEIEIYCASLAGGFHYQPRLAYRLQIPYIPVSSAMLLDLRRGLHNDCEIQPDEEGVTPHVSVYEATIRRCMNKIMISMFAG